MSGSQDRCGACVPALGPPLVPGGERTPRRTCIRGGGHAVRGGEARGDSGGQSRPARGEGREGGETRGRTGCCASFPGGGSGNGVTPGRLRGRGTDCRLSCLWWGAPCLGPGPVLVLNSPSASGGEGLGLSEGWVRSGWHLGSVGPLLAVGHVRWRLPWKAVFPLRTSLSLFGGAVSPLRLSVWGARAWLWCVGPEIPARGRIGPPALGVCNLTHLAGRAFPVPVFIYKSRLSPSHLGTFLNCEKHITEFAILICLPMQETPEMRVLALGWKDPL